MKARIAKKKLIAIQGQAKRVASKAIQECHTVLIPNQAVVFEMLIDPLSRLDNLREELAYLYFFAERLPS